METLENRNNIEDFSDNLVVKHMILIGATDPSKYTLEQNNYAEMFLELLDNIEGYCKKYIEDDNDVIKIKLGEGIFDFSDFVTGQESVLNFSNKHNLLIEGSGKNTILVLSNESCTNYIKFSNSRRIYIRNIVLKSFDFILPVSNVKNIISVDINNCEYLEVRCVEVPFKSAKNVDTLVVYPIEVYPIERATPHTKESLKLFYNGFGIDKLGFIKEMLWALLWRLGLPCFNKKELGKKINIWETERMKNGY